MMRWFELTETERWDSASRQWITDDPPQTQTVEVNGISRPLYNSENGLIAAIPEAQTAFWRWFGNSKVVDDHGRPLVVHRGDKLGKTEFTGRENSNNIGAAPNRILSMPFLGNIFFSNERHIAKGYTSHRNNSYISSKEMNQSHGLYSAYLKIEKPVIVDAKGGDWSRVPVSGKLKKAIGSDGLQIDELAFYVQQKTKSDGLIVKNVQDQYGDGHQFVVFSGQQIKMV